MVTGGPDLQNMECPSCGGAIELRAAGYSTLYACQYCGSEIDLTGSSAKLIAEHVEAARDLIIPLGTMGKVNGVEWAVVGHLEKSDGWDDWQEFLLFNPYNGYRWLVLTQSGWSFGTPILSQPANPANDTFRFEGARMKRIYDPAISTVKRAIGEFYWQVKRGDDVRSTSFVGGGKVLSCELTGDEYNWTLEEFISSADVALAFGVEDTGQYPAIGDMPSPHQPNPHSDKAVNAALVASIGFVLAVLVAVLLSFGGEQRSQTFTASPTSSNRTVSLGTFEVTGRARPFTIKARGEPGDNSWMYVEYTLTNTQTGEEIIASQPIEYYYGRDWKEDARNGTVKLSSVPPGTYELTADVGLPEDEADAAVTASTRNTSEWANAGGGRPVVIEAESNGMFYSNLFLLFLALFLPVGWMFSRALGFETARSSGYDGHDNDG